MREKQTEVTNVKNRLESELKTTSEESERAMAELRTVHSRQMESLRTEMENQMHAIRREHAKVVDNYVARDQAWQLEKEVHTTIRVPFFYLKMHVLGPLPVANIIE